MELKQIEYFLQLAQTEHVSQAADVLNISQPTLSRSLSALERSLGTSLFDRVGNRLRLNASGRVFYSYAQQAMQILETASIAALRSAFELSGNISINCWSFAPILLPCINEYMALNPRVNIQMMQHNHNQDYMADEDYDFILAYALDELEGNQNTQHWVTQPLFSEDCLFVIGPNHPMFSQLEEGAKSVDLPQFASACFITMSQDSVFTDYTYNICQSTGFFPKSYFQTDSFLVKMDMLRAGSAVALLPESNLEEARHICPGLRAFRINHNNFRRTVFIMRKKKSLLGEAALDFWDFLLEYYHLPQDERD